MLCLRRPINYRMENQTKEKQAVQFLTWRHPEKTHNGSSYMTQKIRFPIKDFFSKCKYIRSFLRIWSNILKKFLVENFIFCAVSVAPKAVKAAQQASCVIEIDDSD